MRKVSSGSTAPITIRDTKIIFGKCRGGVIPQLYAAANSSGARMLAMERKLERPAAISPRPKPRPVSNDIAAGHLAKNATEMAAISWRLTGGFGGEKRLHAVALALAQALSAQRGSTGHNEGIPHGDTALVPGGAANLGAAQNG